jgi:hypothetical protein
MYQLRVGFLENPYPSLSLHELCETACTFASETQPGLHANRFVCQSWSRHGDGAEFHARTAEGA